ncbi:MAG: capsule assembly Wzi family protein [Muribaculaceae bacterium]|nr:capsule assembly Wzi family protein [Muribaculaceae bacterium]
MKKDVLKYLTVCAALASTHGILAQTALNYEVSALGSGASGAFAPYFIGSMNGSRIVRKGHALMDAGVSVDLDRSKRFSWAAGAEIITGYSTANDYDRWDGAWSSNVNRPSAVWIQQLYGQIKFRGVQLTVGQRDAVSAILPQELTSGDLTRSGNARGVPGASVGFIDFQDIPFTNGWVQIDGVVDYGMFTDTDFRAKQFNYYTGLLTGNTYYTYKRCYFRTKPTVPFSVTLGMQTAGQFGGWTEYYRLGTMYRDDRRGFRVADVFKMFFPIEGNGNGFYEGNSLGSWDFKARYLLKNGDALTFAFQWPWEDGSGIGHRNGWDGLYGLYYQSSNKGLISGAAVEWVDFRNQSGPIHLEPGDFPGTDLNVHTTGGDNNYNNDTYASYTNYGMAIATPILVAPVYNLNGCSYFLHNCARGLHMALTGYIIPSLGYTLKYSWQQAWGMGRKPSPYCMIDNSILADVRWDMSALAPGWRLGAQVAVDAGRLRGDNFGAMVSISYSGSFNFKK